MANFYSNFGKNDFSIFALVIPLYLVWVLSYTVDSTNQIIYIIIFAGLFYFYYGAHKKNKTKAKLYILALFFLFFLNIFGLKIEQRLNTSIAPQYHDGLPQIEASIDYFLAGKNPYTENYYKSPLGQYNTFRIINIVNGNQVHHRLNPALENYVYPPAQFVLAAPVKLLSENIFGFYDHRFFTLILFVLTLFVVYKLPKSQKNKLSLLVVFMFNPLFLESLAYGYNDVTAILPLLLSLYLLKKNKYYLASFFIAVSILIKYNTVFYLPFFLLYIFIKKQYQFKIKSLLKFSSYAIPMIIPALLLLLPWLIWDFNALYHDTVYYLNHIYPIRSLGLSAYWLKLGIVQSPFEYHPFWIYQIIFLLLVVPPLIKKQFKDNSIHHVYLAGTIVMIGIYFLYRYFTSSQVILIFHNLLIALFI